jgi:hypothetical protein
VRLGQLSLDGGAVIGFGHAGGQDKVDPKGTMADLLPDPGQFVLDLLGGVAGCAKNPESACMANGGHNGGVMGKAKHGLRNTQTFAQAGLQAITQ